MAETKRKAARRRRPRRRWDEASTAAPIGRPEGEILMRNLERLGYTTTTIRCREIATLVTEQGQYVSRQRISQLATEVKINRPLLKRVAKAIGVRPSELLRDDATDSA